MKDKKYIEMKDKKYIEELYQLTTDALLSDRNAAGFWEGHLSSSALGVAVAITTLHFYDPVRFGSQISAGIKWLSDNQNKDGGFGDSPESVSNVSTSLLCLAAVTACRESGSPFRIKILQGLSAYLQAQQIDISSNRMLQTVLDFYQTDRTFSVPILTMCALCGIPGREAFDRIPQLPFELALTPRSFYNVLNLNVVSYAIPALIAVGIAIFRFKPRKNFLMRRIRKMAEKPALRLLEQMKPGSGGFLEAIPLTAFVCLCLVVSGYREHPVVCDGISFLERTQRADGSWPIDVDLSSWVTSLAVKSFRSYVDIFLPENEKKRLTDHYLSIQNKTTHPFNGALPGGWGWTHFAGSVPDCDDTPGAILALLSLNQENPELIKQAALDGCLWMVRLQNSDGGFPTFSRGWGKLPFDQSCADLTGHAVLAIAKVLDTYPSGENETMALIRRSFKKGIAYLQKHQRSDGSWLPLWFGSQLTPDHSNPVYGTARVLTYLADANSCRWIELEHALHEKIARMNKRAAAFLVSAQNQDGSWGGDKNMAGTIEETALAVSALLAFGLNANLESGVNWLADKIKSDGFEAAPIGLYFASLWYSERLYPLTATMECLSRLKERQWD